MSTSAYCRRPKDHAGECTVNPIAQPGDVDKQHNPPPYAGWPYGEVQTEDENTAQADAEAAWKAYRDAYVRQRPYLLTPGADPKRASRQMRKREFIAGYLAALPEWNG